MQDARYAERWANAATIAAGLRVPAAIGDYLILEAIRDSGGTAITVTRRRAARRHARWPRAGKGSSSRRSRARPSSPRASCARAAFLQPDDLTVIFATGSGLMHVDVVTSAFPTIDPNAPDLVSAIADALGWR